MAYVAISYGELLESDFDLTTDWQKIIIRKNSPLFEYLTFYVETS